MPRLSVAATRGRLALVLFDSSKGSLFPSEGRCKWACHQAPFHKLVCYMSTQATVAVIDSILCSSYHPHSANWTVVQLQSYFAKWTAFKLPVIVSIIDFVHKKWLFLMLLAPFSLFPWAAGGGSGRTINLLYCNQGMLVRLFCPALLEVGVPTTNRRSVVLSPHRGRALG